MFKLNLFLFKAWQVKTLSHKNSGTIVIDGNYARVLIYSSATHLFVSILFGMKLARPSSTLPCDLGISTLMGETVLVKACYVDCELSLDGKTFLATLIPLPMVEFDVILGMDFLSSYRAKFDCLRKEVTLCSPIGEKIKFYGEKQA